MVRMRKTRTGDVRYVSFGADPALAIEFGVGGQAGLHPHDDGVL